MTGRYEGERPLGLFGGHEVKKAAHGGFALVAALVDPMDRQANHGPAHHGQIECGGASANATPVFPGDHIQAQMQTGFDAPMPTVGRQHLLGTQRGGGERAKQVLSFDLGGRMFVTVQATG